MWNRMILTICLVFVLTGLALAGDMTRATDRDFDKLRAAGNRYPKGIWSDGTTMWVLDDYDDKIYAYNLRTRARDRGKDFNTLDASDRHSGGIWSDGTTMWVVDDYHDKIYAYNMRSKARNPDKDFDLSVKHGIPEGIWSDGTTMWVADRALNEIFAYNMRTKAHDSAKDFRLRNAVSASPMGIWSDGTTMWVVDDWDKTICAYNLRSQDRDPKDCNRLATGNNDPMGIWSDGTTMWVVDDSDDKIYAYDYPTATSNQNTRSEQALQDFSMKIRGRTGSLKVCVRDHECEDGDKIRVEVDGRSIFSGEIDNDWDCYTLDVWAGGSYAVELTALNGTGYKGDCSHADANTGEIRVTGENTETQVWRHRGGAGSKARIIVETVR